LQEAERRAQKAEEEKQKAEEREAEAEERALRAEQERDQTKTTLKSIWIFVTHISPKAS